MLVFLIMPHTVHTDSLRYNIPHASVSSLSHDPLWRSAQYSHFIRASSPPPLLTATAPLLESHHSFQKLFAYDLISHNFEWTRSQVIGARKEMEGWENEWIDVAWGLSDIPVWKDHLTAEPRNPALLIERHLSDPLAMLRRTVRKAPWNRSATSCIKVFPIETGCLHGTCGIE